MKGIIKATLVCLMLLAVGIALSESALSEESAPVGVENKKKRRNSI